MSWIKISLGRPEQSDWLEFKPLFGGGKIKIFDTLRVVTPIGGGATGKPEILPSKSANECDPGLEIWRDRSPHRRVPY
jgi:hypothetical protein